MNAKLRSLVISWDTLVGFVTFAVLQLVLPNELKSGTVKDVYGVAVAILAIVFGLFVAALTLMVSTSDDQFVAFLEEDGLYTKILNSFLMTARALFATLVYSMTIYGLTSYRLGEGYIWQPSYWMSTFAAAFMYCLTAAHIVTEDCIKFASYRSRHLLSVALNNRMKRNLSAAVIK